MYSFTRLGWTVKKVLQVVPAFFCKFVIGVITVFDPLVVDDPLAILNHGRFHAFQEFQIAQLLMMV